MDFNIEKLIRPNILALQAYSSARGEYKGEQAIFLDANENPFGEYNRYPDPYQQKLKELISDIKNIPTENIFIGNGSDEIIDLAFRIFCNPGVDVALTFSPTYGMYEVCAKINNVNLIERPLTKFAQIDLDDFKSFLSYPNLKLILICSPNNPTGNHFEATTIDYILSNFNGIVIIDEAYIDFSERPSYINKLKEYPNLIVSQTLSKAWGLAGLRLGLAFMSNELLHFFNKVKAPYNISTINQKYALEVLANKTNIDKQISIILLEKKRLYDELKKLHYVLHIYPSDANFWLIKVKNSTALYDFLAKRNIVIRNRSKIISNCIRITIGLPNENNLLIKYLKEFIDV